MEISRINFYEADREVNSQVLENQRKELEREREDVLRQKKMDLHFPRFGIHRFPDSLV